MSIIQHLLNVHLSVLLKMIFVLERYASSNQCNALNSINRLLKTKDTPMIFSSCLYLKKQTLYLQSSFIITVGLHTSMKKYLRFKIQ